jgi:hypothetical protein
LAGTEGAAQELAAETRSVAWHYYIRDSASGKGYVGSASGAENICGRWSGYAANGHGGNRLLRDVKPENLSFSILQRVSPDLPKDDVLEIESSWKQRLQTRASLGLNDNLQDNVPARELAFIPSVAFVSDMR